MLILENVEKVMKEGLATKGPSFLVWLALLSTEKLEKHNKAESAVKWCILILDGQKVVEINPESEINHS